MKGKFRELLLGVIVCVLIVSKVSQAAQQQIPISTVDDIARDFESVPCSNSERLNASRALFEKMQAPPSAISVEKFPGVDNLTVRQPGTSQEIIVIGAHYDIAERGCGAVDNWSGVVALAHLYKTIRVLKTNKAVIFVAFGKEEKGLLGSKAMVGAIQKEQIPSYCAMINIDSFGLAAPFALQDSSSKKLVNLAEEISKQMQIPFANIQLNGDSDSSSFIAKKIPAITLSGLSNDWESILHTTSDQAKKVNPYSVYLGYRLALTMWGRVEQAACDSYK